MVAVYTRDELRDDLAFTRREYAVRGEVELTQGALAYHRRRAGLHDVEFPEDEAAAIMRTAYTKGVSRLVRVAKETATSGVLVPDAARRDVGILRERAQRYGREGGIPSQGIRFARIEESLRHALG